MTSLILIINIDVRNCVFIKWTRKHELIEVLHTFDSILHDKDSGVVLWI